MGDYKTPASTFAGSTLTAHTLVVDYNASVGVDVTIGRNLSVVGITTVEHLHSTDDIVVDDSITATEVFRVQVEVFKV